MNFLLQASRSLAEVGYLVDIRIVDTGNEKETSISSWGPIITKFQKIDAEGIRFMKSEQIFFKYIPGTAKVLDISCKFTHFRLSNYKAVPTSCIVLDQQVVHEGGTEPVSHLCQGCSVQ